jgi:hypothetical protein
MFNGYHLMNRGHGLQALAKPIYKPLMQLGIGQDEVLYNLDMKVEYHQKKQVAITPDLDSAPLTLATFDGKHDNVEEANLPKAFYVGEALGGI